MRTIKKLLPLAWLAVPFIASAQTIENIVAKIQSIATLLVPIFITIALIYFIYGVIKYITAGGEEEERKKARNTIIYGIIGLFAIVSVWGLITILNRFFGVSSGGTIPRPIIAP